MVDAEKCQLFPLGKVVFHFHTFRRKFAQTLLCDSPAIVDVPLRPTRVLKFNPFYLQSVFFPYIYSPIKIDNILNM